MKCTTTLLKRNGIISFFLALSICFSAYSHTIKNVIFDVGDVLLQTGTGAPLGYLWKKILTYAATGNNPFKAQKILFESLHKIKPLSNPTIRVEDGKGNNVPELMREWLAGTTTGAEILAILNEYCATHPQEFSNLAECELVKAAATFAFSPDLMSKSQKLIPSSFEFVKNCKAQGHKLYILSNWDPVSCGMIMARYPQLFSLFDGILISGTAGYIKPDVRIYQALLTKFNLDPHECIFIDDQPHNLTTAQSLGINTILCPKQASIYAPWSHHVDMTSVRMEYEKIVHQYAQA